jgi:Peptidase family M28/PDZ domain
VQRPEAAAVSARSVRALSAFLASLLAAPLAAQGVAGAQKPPASAVQPGLDALRRDIRYLAGDALAGRMTGSPGADSAAAYIARRFAQVGLQAPPGGWFQRFTVAPDAPAAAHAGAGGAAGANVIGILPGRDAVLRNEVVIVGAHYDHLGLGGSFALDPDSTGAIHNGADDNASGTVALFRIAERLRAARPARTVVFIAFSAEELGLLGSAHYAGAPTYPLATTRAMVNLDMVGRLRNDRLIVYGSATATEFPALLDSLNRHHGFALHHEGDGYGRSDQSSFYAAGVPVLHMFTDLHEDYHRAGDDWEKLDLAGLARVADFTAAAVAAIADRPAALTFVNLPPPRPAAGGGGYGAYLGSVPDMAGGVRGVRLTGVRKDSPADQAGLRAGDVIVRIGGSEVADLQGMTDALRAHQPGDVVDIVFLRDGAEHTAAVTLGRRGG